MCVVLILGFQVDCHHRRLLERERVVLGVVGAAAESSPRGQHARWRPRASPSELAPHLERAQPQHASVRGGLAAAVGLLGVPDWAHHLDGGGVAAGAAGLGELHSVGTRQRRLPRHRRDAGAAGQMQCQTLRGHRLQRRHRGVGLVAEREAQQLPLDGAI